jgi:hypothetical protein
MGDSQRRMWWTLGLLAWAPNLGILGASVMGTSGARNPTLTAQALSGGRRASGEELEVDCGVRSEAWSRT